MLVRPLVCAVVVTLALAACGETPAYVPDGPTLTFRVETLDGKPATEHEIAGLSSIVRRRMDGAGYSGFASHASTDDDMLTVRIDKALAPDIDRIAALIARPGTLELRIEAGAYATRKQRELFDASGGVIKPPPEYAWVPRKVGGPDMLVCTPERGARYAVDKLKRKGVAEDSAEMSAAVAAYEQVVRDDVFTGDQLGDAEAQTMNAMDVVFFSFKDERKAHFGRFTEKHVKENLAIILDGKVDSAPVIVSKLPGEGILQGGGPSGFTLDEAKALAALLSSGALPCRLVRVASPETK